MNEALKTEFEFLKNEAEKLNINLSVEAVEKLSIFTDSLLKWNEVMNLTAITEPHVIMIKHFLDSIYPLGLKLIQDNARVIDVGCGAGFPGIPLKLAKHNINLTLLDSLNKRINFINSFIAEIKEEKVDVVCGRAEEKALDKSLREKFDVAVSRAVAELRILCEYCIPFLKPGGIFIAYKGRSANEELKGAEKAIKELGCEVSEVKNVVLPETDADHYLIILKKVKNTPPQYPRRMAKITKSPL